MHPSDRLPPHRTLRLYEWLLLLALLFLLGGVRAESVYKCMDAQGDVAYQQRPCAPSQSVSVIAIDPAPAYAPSPQYAVPRETPADSKAQHRAKAEHSRASAYECRASNGQVFYRLNGCPRSIASVEGAGAHKRGRGSSNSVSVSARLIPRSQACAQIHHAGAIGRDGHQLDETTSTYERNLGNDPCK